MTIYTFPKRTNQKDKSDTVFLRILKEIFIIHSRSLFREPQQVRVEFKFNSIQLFLKI